MNMIRWLYFIAATYDGLLGLLFLVAGSRIFALLGITPPNHWGYVDFSAGILVIFGWMFLQIGRNPLQSLNLIPYGILLKVCYVGTVLWYTLDGDIPSLWKWFAIADALFAVLFVWSLKQLRKTH